MDNRKNKNTLHNNPIDAFQINSARELHRLTTGSRHPIKPLDSTIFKSPNNTIIPSATNTTTSISTTSNSNNKLDNSLNISIEHPDCKNPLCHDCGQVIIPAPVATLPLIDNPSICINNKWFICTQRLPILNAGEIENFEKILNDLPVPEMIFGNNKVEILFKDTDNNNNNNNNNDIKFHIMFNALDALKMVARNPENLLQVSYANEWFKSRQLKHKNSENVSLEVYKPYDWTYSSNYKGSIFIGNWIKDLDDSFTIPLDKLTSNNPIKFYDDMILYEDELGDNGISMLNVKIRVMSNCLLLLQRLFIRVDNVLVKIIDTRLYIDFDDCLVIREQKLMQQDYNSLLKNVIGPDPKKMMRDINWCSNNLPVIDISREYMILQ